uniref:Uncharacterized protein n=1 Tax=Arundo donax TaxID=35708 RepID=A0A0A8ZN54_ARUDO
MHKQDRNDTNCQIDGFQNLK